MRITAHRCWTIAAALLITASACGPRGRNLSELTASLKSEPYRVRAGDVLAVNVWGEPQLSQDALVREDGHFTMPLINDVEAAGQTVDALSKSVTEKLSKYVPGASVAISLSQTAPVRYYLLGKFQKPGEFRSSGKITLLQAIASGGGFAPFADESSIVLIRNTPEGEVRYVLDYGRVKNGTQPNPELHDGDTVNID